MRQTKDDAAIAVLFGMDPCDVADEPDPRRRAYRLATYIAHTS